MGTRLYVYCIIKGNAGICLSPDMPFLVDIQSQESKTNGPEEAPSGTSHGLGADTGTIYVSTKIAFVSIQ